MRPRGSPAEERRKQAGPQWARPEFDALEVGDVVSVNWLPPGTTKQGTIVAKTRSELTVDMGDAGGLYLPRSGLTRVMKVWRG